MRNLVIFGILFFSGSVYCQTTKDFFTVNMSLALTSFILPTTGTGYSYTVYFGDGSAIQNVVTDNSPSHNYNMANAYKVRVSVCTNVAFPRIYFNNSGNKLNITAILQLLFR